VVSRLRTHARFGLFFCIRCALKYALLVLKSVFSVSSVVRMRLICNNASKCLSPKDYCLLTGKGFKIDRLLSDNLLLLEAIKVDPTNVRLSGTSDLV